jgi:Tfp pilus assembly pilus retraction ATPase PilT
MSARVGAAGDVFTPERPALRGDLAVFSLLDVAQMLALCGHTGVLTVRHDQRRGDFHYREGAIISVTDDRGNDGMVAAVGILLREGGTFEFVACDVQVARTVTESSDAFLLEVARQVDEMRERLGGGDDGDGRSTDLSVEASLLLKRRAMERLRELFSNVTSETESSAADIFDLDVLAAEPGRLGVEAIYLRPGQRPVARRGRQMVPLWRETLTSDHIELWLRDVAPPHAVAVLEHGAGSASFELRARDGCLLDIAAHHESTQLSCVVRVVAPRVDEPDALGLDPSALEPLLDRRRGLLVLAGPRGRARARAFAALTTLGARQRGGLVVTAERQRHSLLEAGVLDELGVAIFQRRTRDAAELADALAFVRSEEADLLATDPLGPPVLAEIGDAAWPLLVIGTVTGRGAIAGLHRLLAIITADGGADDAAAWIGRHLAGVVAIGRLTAAGGSRPATEVLAVDQTVAELVAAGRLDDLERAFVAGRLAGSVSLAEQAAQLGEQAA